MLHRRRRSDSISVDADPQRDRKSLSIYGSLTAFRPALRTGNSSAGGFFWFQVRGRQSEGSLLDPTDGLHLVGVSLGAVLVVVSVLSLVSVSLHDVLVTTVTRELIGNPAAGTQRGGGGGRGGGVTKGYCRLHTLITEDKRLSLLFYKDIR